MYQEIGENPVAEGPFPENKYEIQCSINSSKDKTGFFVLCNKYAHVLTDTEKMIEQAAKGGIAGSRSGNIY